MSGRIKVQAPATLSNLNCGFDVLGVAVSANCDDIIGRRLPRPGIELILSGTNARQTPADPTRNTAGVAVMKLFEYLGMTKADGIELEIRKEIRPGSGLGSSAASACGAVFLANELLGRPLDRRTLLPFALLGEYAADRSFHADNVAPCLLGGLVLVRDFRSLDIHKLIHPQGLTFSLVYPDVRVLTSESRAALSPTVPLRNFVNQTANLAGFVHAMIRSDLDLLSRAMKDEVIEPQRASAIPHFELIRDTAFSEGALAVGISGSGPTVFALSANNHIAENCAVAMQRILTDRRLASEAMVAGINESGVELC